MSLKFIFGNSGAGKSYYLYQEIIKASIQNPHKNYIVLVPEQFTMQTQQDLVRMHPRGGIMNIDVLSFGRLAFRILNEVGGFSRTILDDEGKTLVLRKIAGDCEERLKVLRGSLKKTGYISEIKSILSEFVQYDVTTEAIEEVIQDAGAKSYLGCKLKDIQTVYTEFNCYLAGKYITREEILDILCLVLKDSRLMKDSVVALDGFTGFTPVQNKVICECMRHSEQVMVTVTMDEREDPFILKHKYQLFAISKQMVTSLTDIAKEHKVVLEEPAYLYQRPVYRFRENAVMDHLEKGLFRMKPAKYEGEQGAISLHCAGNPRLEIEFAAQKILHLIRSQGYQYRDIALITNDISIYGNCIEEVFEIYGIPYFMDQKRSILLNSFVEYLRSLLAMIAEGFSKDGVFRFLRTGLTDFTQDENDLLENYVTALGIKGYKRWQEKWIRRPSGFHEEELSVVNGLRVRFVEQIDGVILILKQRKKTVRDITLALYDFFVKEDIQRKLKNQEFIFEQNQEQALAKEYAQIYRIVIELFDKFVELLGDETISLNDYNELLDAGLAEAKVGVIPPGTDQVTIGDLERSRLNEIKALFFIGANDTLLPGNLQKGGFLTEHDREKFEDCRVHLSPGSKEKIYTQKFYLYMNLTKPTEYLFLSYSKVSLSGSGLRPAYLIGEMKRVFPRLTVQEEDQVPFDKKELTPESALGYLIHELQDKSRNLGSEWQELYTWYLKHPEWSQRIRAVIEAGFYRKNVSRLTDQIAQKLYGADFKESVTRLERFSACAFAHFLTYGLRLKEREEFEFAAIDMGNVFHNALERFSKKLEKTTYRWTDIPDEVCEAMIEECVQESIIDYGNTVLYSSARNLYMITRMKRWMQRTVWAIGKQLEKGDFAPSGYELVFPGGKIDRVDTCVDDNRVYVKVIDYKTGAKSFDLVALYHGLQMQLIVYMNAAVAIEQKNHPGKDVIPAGVFYYKIKDPIVDWQEDDQKLAEMILKELKLDGLANSEPDVVEHLERDLSGHSFVLPLSKNKDGSLSKQSKALNTDEFAVVTDFAKRQSHEIRKRILSGEIEVSPYELGKDTGCDYCGYRHICGFDKGIEGFEYRRLSQYDREELLARMKENNNEDTK